MTGKPSGAHRRRRAAVAAAALVAMAATASGVAARSAAEAARQDEAKDWGRFLLFNECAGMATGTYWTSIGDSTGVSSERMERSIDHLVENRIRLARLLSKETDDPPALLFLYAEYVPGWVFIDIEFQKPVEDPATGVRDFATTYGFSNVQIAETPADVREAVGTVLDVFLGFYINVNEDACNRGERY